MTRREIQSATRTELISYLEDWGYTCFDRENTPTDDLRALAIDNWSIEGC